MFGIQLNINGLNVSGIIALKFLIFFCSKFLTFNIQLEIKIEKYLAECIS